MFARGQSSFTTQLLRRVVILSVLAVIGLVLAGGFGIAASLLAAQQDLTREAADAARQFDLFLADVRNDLQAVAGSMSYIEDDEMNGMLRSTLERRPVVYELTLLEPDGTVRASRRLVGASTVTAITAQPWLGTVQAGDVYVGPVEFREEFGGVPLLNMAVGVTRDGEFAGTLLATLDLGALWSEVVAIRIGESGYAYIVDEDERLLAYSDLELVREGAKLSELTDRSLDSILDTGLLSLMTVSRGLNDRLDVSAGARLSTVSWYAVVEQPASEGLSGFLPVFFVLVGSVAVAIGLVYSLVRFTRGQVTQPLQGIIAGARIFGAGDLDHRIERRGSFELRDLADTLNQMVRDLQDSRHELEDVNRTLEQRVQARTEDLFHTIQVGQLATRIYQQTDLLPRVTSYIRDQFDLYYTQIYLLDEAQRFAVLMAGTGKVGQELLQRGHKLALDETSIVARAVQTGQPVLVSDTATSPVHKPNPLLPATRSEVAIPLVVGDEVLGVLDMQAVDPDTFSDDNLPVFEAMASQLAAALRSAQAFEDARSAADRADAINRRLTAERWEAYLGRLGEKGQVRYEYDLQNVVLNEEEGIEILPAGNGHGQALTMPVTLRGQSIGSIMLGDDARRVWDDDDRLLAQEVAARVALALEQFRAFDETQKRAAEMQTVAEVSAEASTSLDPQALLQNVSNLAKERFGLYHAHVYLIDDSGTQLLLAAGAGDAGERMVASGHRIALSNEMSLVARAGRTREPVIVNDVKRSPTFLPNPLLPFTRAEMALPMIAGDALIGVLDVQSDRANYFTDEDAQVQITLASQVAVAVQNARLYAEQVQVADRLREVDRVKSEFLASMSHELRTPLNSIIGYAEVLLDGIDGELNEDMEEDIGAIHGSGKHLLNLINDILDLAKIEAGQLDLVMEVLDFKPLAEDMLNTSKVLLMDRAVDLVLDVPDNLPSVHADPLRVRQIINNILGNAIKFTEEGSITISADVDERDPNMLHVVIQDTGIGMSAEDLPLIFERFRQVDQSHTRRKGGTGLGLAITRQLAQMHGGEIWVESEVGVGSAFHFTLPLATEPQGS